MLPLDVMLCVIDWLDLNSLRELSLVNSSINNCVNRRLWCTSAIGSLRSQDGSTLQHVRDGCLAILRRPDRAIHIRKLVIAPCTWPWTIDLLRNFERIWRTSCNISSLLLCTFETLIHRETNDFSPLFRTLVSHGQDLRLRAFRCKGWLRPNSDLYKFLSSQPTIEKLIDLDVFDTRPLPPDPNFLPILRYLHATSAPRR